MLMLYIDIPKDKCYQGGVGFLIGSTMGIVFQQQINRKW